jgi:hypothetical protein
MLRKFSSAHKRLESALAELAQNKDAAKSKRERMDAAKIEAEKEAEKCRHGENEKHRENADSAIRLAEILKEECIVLKAERKGLKRKAECAREEMENVMQELASHQLILHVGKAMGRIGRAGRFLTRIENVSKALGVVAISGMLSFALLSMVGRYFISQSTGMAAAGASMGVFLVFGGLCVLSSEIHRVLGAIFKAAKKIMPAEGRQQEEKAAAPNELYA